MEALRSRRPRLGAAAVLFWGRGLALHEGTSAVVAPPPSPRIYGCSHQVAASVWVQVCTWGAQHTQRLPSLPRTPRSGRRAPAVLSLKGNFVTLAQRKWRGGGYSRQIAPSFNTPPTLGAPHFHASPQTNKHWISHYAPAMRSARGGHVGEQIRNLRPDERGTAFSRPRRGVCDQIPVGGFGCRPLRRRRSDRPQRREAGGGGQSALGTGSGRGKPSQESRNATLPSRALLEALRGPGGRRPEKTQSEGKLAPLVLQIFQVNSEPERETAAVPREANWPSNSRKEGDGRWANVCALKVVALLGEEAAGVRAASATFPLPKKGSRSGDFGRRSPSPGQFSWRPFAGRVCPSRHAGGRRPSPLTPGPPGWPRPRRALSRRAEPARVWAPRGVCAPARLL